MKKFISVIMLCSSLFGCAVAPQQQLQIQEGMVIGIQSTTFTEHDPNLAGAAIGATAGGIIGHQFGKGDGKTSMTFLGVLGGAAIGSQVNSNKTVQGYSVTCRGNNGEIFTVNSKIPLQV